MNYISANIDLQDYESKYIVVDLNGVHKKFTVQQVDNTLVYPASSILLNDYYSILGLANIQDCPSCSATFLISEGIQEQFLSVGDRARLSVSTVGNTEDLVYQWYYNGTKIDGANTDNYVIPPVIPPDNGSTYSISITGLCNTASSENKIWLGFNQYFASACGIPPTNVFNYSLKDNTFRYDNFFGNLVNGVWVNDKYLYYFVNGEVLATTVSCLSSNTWDLWVDPQAPATTTPTPTTTPCPCTNYLFYSSCFPEEDDEGFTLSYCCGVFYEGMSPYTGNGYRGGYMYVFIAGIIQGSGSPCTTTTPPPCIGTTFFNNCGETGGTTNLYQCGPYWYTEVPANVSLLATGNFSKDGFLYQFTSGVITSISVCPSCYSETYYLDCTEGAGTITLWTKGSYYFYESTDCSNYDPTNPDSIPSGLVDGVEYFGADYPGRTEYEFGGGTKGIVGNCTTIRPTTTPPPECCASFGYSPYPLEEWGSNYGEVTVYCPNPINAYKNCYQYVPPVTTTTTPAPCPTGSIYVPTNNYYNFNYDGYGNLNITYTPYSNPLSPITLNPPRGTPFALYSSDCVAGGTNLFIVAGCYSVGSACGATTTTTTTTTTTICPGAGTLLTTYCSGYDLHGTYADGICGTYDELIEANSPSCGYTTTTTPGP